MHMRTSTFNRRRWVRVVLLGAISLPACMQGGCAGSQGPEALIIDAADYQAAFDAASEAVRVQGMPPILQDRRAGVIETDARIAASLIEPWRNDNASFNQATENTLAMQRRRARFEFMPAGSPQPQSAPVPTGPSVAIAAASPVDLTHATGPLELRVRVFVDRAQTPGVRRSTWTRAETTTAQLVAPEGLTGGTYWVPFTRDLAFERRLLDSVQQAIASDAPAATNP